jgi:hypothetical protein
MNQPRKVESKNSLKPSQRFLSCSENWKGRNKTSQTTQTWSQEDQDLLNDVWDLLRQPGEGLTTNQLMNEMNNRASTTGRERLYTVQEVFNYLA